MRFHTQLGDELASLRSLHHFMVWLHLLPLAHFDGKRLSNPRSSTNDKCFLSIYVLICCSNWCRQRLIQPSDLPLSRKIEGCSTSARIRVESTSRGPGRLK